MPGGWSAPAEGRWKTVPILGTALALTLIPLAAAAVSGAVAALRRPGARLTSGLQHFAAGVVFAAAAIELVPGVLQAAPRVAIVGFGVGMGVMFGFRALSEWAERRREQRGLQGLPVGLATATAIDFFIDGVILGAGFAAAARTGLLLTIALAIEYLFVGLSLAATMAGKTSRKVVAAAPVVLALLTMLGTVLGVVTLSGASASLLAGVLAFGRWRSCTWQPRSFWLRPTKKARPPLAASGSLSAS
jgi:zinc transporter, ZIP family